MYDKYFYLTESVSTLLKILFDVLVTVAISESDPWKTSIKATLRGENYDSPL